jgi:small nuclear ribonucleoprotein (snRNP)-like protein
LFSSLFLLKKERLYVQLRDGRKFEGILRSFDQFANIILESGVERFDIDGKIGEKPRGLLLIKGDTVVLMGEIDTAQHSLLGQSNKIADDQLDEAYKNYEKRRLAALNAASALVDDVDGDVLI